MSESNGRSAKEIRDAGLPVLAEWLLMLPHARSESGLPDTQKGLAELLGVSEATITVWKKTKQLQAVVSQHLRTNFGADRLGRVIDALYDHAVNGVGASQVSAAKTLLQWHKEDVEAFTAQDMKDLPDDEVDALFERVKAEDSE